MKVHVTASGLLADHLPAGSGGRTTIEVSEAAALVAVMQAAGIPESAKPLISLNGTVVPRSLHATRTVSEGDEVRFMPNLKGG